MYLTISQRALTVRVCAWPDPKHSASFDICENGAKAIAWEVTDKQVNASFFAENTVQSLLTWGDHELEAAGRLTQPLKYDAVSDCYKPLSWQQAFRRNWRTPSKL